MKHALLVEVPDWDSLGNPVPVACAEVLVTLLEALGGWSIEVLAGPAATREGVLEALGRLQAACGPGDACLFHFFGHGRVERFEALAVEVGDRPVHYLATLRPPGAAPVGVCDFEVSAALTELDARCGNVTAVIDCCRAATMVRGVVDESPAWAVALGQRLRRDAALRQRALATESHPRIVRLAAASSWRVAFAGRGPRGKCGWLTQGLVAVVREAGLRCDRLTWDAVAHRIREATSRAGSSEEQRVVLAGPRHRLLFSTVTVSLPPTAAYVPREPARGEELPARGWLRVGSLQGVEVGDRWGVTALPLDDALLPRVVADLEVERVGLDASEVRVTSEAPPTLALGATAVLRAPARRMPVAVGPGSIAGPALAASSWLCCVPEPTPGVVRVIERAATEGGPAALELHEASGRVAWSSAALDGPACEGEAAVAALVGLVEDRARAARLEGALEASAGWLEPDAPLRLRWGTFDGDARRVVADEGERPRLDAGDRVWLELLHEGDTPPHWFASVVAMLPDGRLRLLNAHEPDGLELRPGTCVQVGLRGCSPGLRLEWPAGVPRDDGPRTVALVVLASRRPLPLSSLVRAADPEDPAAFVAEGLPPPARAAAPVSLRRGRGRGEGLAPVTSRAWAWVRAELELHPHGSTSSDAGLRPIGSAAAGAAVGTRAAPEAPSALPRCSLVHRGTPR